MSRSLLGMLRAYALVVAALMIVPLVIVVVASATADGYVVIPPAHWGIRWYREAFADRSFVGSFFFSVETAAAVALISGVLGLLSAIAVQRYSFPGKHFLHGLLMAPMLLPHIVVAIGLIQLFSTLHLNTAPLGLVGGHIVIALPFVMRLTLAGMAGIDPMLEIAGMSLGASRFTAVRRILVPLIAPALISGIVFAFLLSFDEAVIAIFMSEPGKTTVPVQIFNFAEQRSDPLVAAVSSLMIILAVVVILLVDHFFGVLRLLSGGEFADRQAPGRSS